MQPFYKRLPWWSLVLWLCVAASSASASSIAPPIVRTYVYDLGLAGLIDQQVFVVPAQADRPLGLGASISQEPGGFPMDVYLGVIVPGGKVFSWVPKPGGGASVVSGLSPVARSVTEPSFTTRNVFGADAQYTFTEADALGLYSVFTLLVPAGKDPGDARQWHWVSMVPVVFRGLTAPAQAR